MRFRFCEQIVRRVGSQSDGSDQTEDNCRDMNDPASLKFSSEMQGVKLQRIRSEKPGENGENQYEFMLVGPKMK